MLSPILSVHGVAASIRFYVEALQFTHAWSMTDDDGAPNFASVKFGDAEIMLGTIDFVDEADRQRLGKGIQMHIALPQDYDIDGLYAQAQAKSGTITRPIEDREWGERAFAVKDPDGYHFMFARPLKKA